MKTLGTILLALLCLDLFTECRVNAQPLVSSKEAAMRSTPDGPSLGPLRRHSPSPIQLVRVAVLSDSALPAGVYTVGQAGSFPTIDSAFSKITRYGILGGVTLTLIDTLYRARPGRRFELGQIAGAGPNARVTIRPAVNTRVTIVGDSNAVLTFTNVKYLTLDGRSNPPSPSAGITVHALYNQTSAWNSCVEAWGDADYNQFLYLTLKTDDFRNVTPGGGDCIVLGSLGTSMAPDSNLVEGNLMSGVFGVYVGAWLTSPPSRPRGNIIRGNTYGQITDLHGAWGIQSEICEGTLIEGNTVQFMQGAYQTTNNGRIWTIGINAYIDLNTTIRNNVVHAVYTSNSAELYGILGSGGTAGTGTGLLIYNNMVYDLQNTSTTGNACIEGINLWSNVNNQIFYNTVYLSGTGANPIGVDALCLYASVTNTTLRNNVFVNIYRQTSGPGSTALWTNGILTSDYNDLCADTAFANSYTAWLNSYYRTFSNWQGAGYDQHSVSELPHFRTPHLHIDSTFATLLNGHAAPLTGITTDFDGQMRDASTPDIGVDEFSASTPPAPGWVTQTSGVTTGLYSVKAVDINVAWTGGAGGTVLRTINGGTTWTSVGAAPISGDVYSVAAVDANTAFVTTSPSAAYIYRTTNGGTTWTQVYTASAFINALAMADATTGYAVGEAPGGRWLIAKSTDGGATWARMATEPTRGGEVGWTCSLQVMKSGANTYIWFGSNGSHVYRSTDGGATWSTGATAFANSYELQFNSPTQGVVGGESAARTTDGGVTWIATTVPGSDPIFSVAGSGTKDYWVIRGSVSYRSTDAGITWATSYTGTRTFFHSDFANVGSNTQGWAVGDSGSITAFYGTITGIKDQTNEIPMTFTLEQNYPNPFNPVTNFKFSIVNSQLTILKVYDVLGREVATLVNEVKQPGTYRVQWDASGLASGVYFYRLSTTNFVQTRKLLLLR